MSCRVFFWGQKLRSQGHWAEAYRARRCAWSTNHLVIIAIFLCSFDRKEIRNSFRLSWRNKVVVQADLCVVCYVFSTVYMYALCSDLSSQQRTASQRRMLAIACCRRWAGWTAKVSAKDTKALSTQSRCVMMPSPQLMLKRYKWLLVKLFFNFFVTTVVPKNVVIVILILCCLNVGFITVIIINLAC